MARIVFFIVLILVLTAQEAVARTFQYQLTGNYLQFSNSQIMSEIKDVKKDERVEGHNEPALVVPVVSDSQIRIKTGQPWTYVLKPGITGISFEFMLESSETLVAFDEPAFYISLDNQGERKIIYTHCLSGEKTWQKVNLSIADLDFDPGKLVFWAGNLGDDQQETQVLLRSISEDYSLKNRHCQPVTNFLAFLESDGSVTIEINAEAKASWRNYTWWGKCGAAEPRQLIVTNYYLLPNYQIVDLWPNLGQKMLFNLTDFPCVDLSSLTLESCS